MAEEKPDEIVVEILAGIDMYKNSDDVCNAIVTTLDHYFITKNQIASIDHYESTAILEAKNGKKYRINVLEVEDLG